ncbi:66_t:CDS:2 [Funneliformis geosporum]|nr:66_t:CDS:2 [Funneliformis geosporum]
MTIHALPVVEGDEVESRHLVKRCSFFNTLLGGCPRSGDICASDQDCGSELSCEPAGTGFHRCQ